MTHARVALFPAASLALFVALKWMIDVENARYFALVAEATTWPA